MELATARNLFLFSCYTGVAYCDMVALNREHLFTDDEGALWLKFRRQKTNTLCRVKLLSEASGINRRNVVRSLLPLLTQLTLSSSKPCNFGLVSSFLFRHTDFGGWNSDREHRQDDGTFVHCQHANLCLNHRPKDCKGYEEVDVVKMDIN